MPSSPTIPSARDVMATEVATLTADMDIQAAIDMLLDRRFSGAPVVDHRHRLVGVLSEKDCLNVLSSDAFHGLRAGTVADFMTPDPMTIRPGLDIFSVADLFLHHPFRRLPVVDEDKLVGQVSRRDVLLGIRMMREKDDPYQRFPDYRRPQ